MTNTDGTRYTVTARDQIRSSRKTSPLTVFGGAALTCIGMACAWTLVANLTGAAPAVVSANFASVAKTEQVAFTDRFAPMLLARPVAPKRKNQYVALLDPTYSLGPPPGMFGNSLPPSPDTLSIAMASQSDIANPRDDLPLPVVRQLTHVVPLPPRRPADLRLPQNDGPSLREIAQASKAMAVATAATPKPTIFDKLFGKAVAPLLAYAAPDGGVMSDGRDSAGARPGLYDRSTAVYDISARMVYMPDGTKLEAHSGLGSKLDDPRYVHVKMHGATPPHVYDLEPREALFHGVPALRLKPVGGEDAIFGRTGLLAHTYMLGPNGDSNGCVSFKDYNAFLRAYRNGDVKRLAVLARVE